MNSRGNCGYLGTNWNTLATSLFSVQGKVRICSTSMFVCSRTATILIINGHWYFTHRRCQGGKKFRIIADRNVWEIFWKLRIHRISLKLKWFSLKKNEIIIFWYLIYLIISSNYTHTFGFKETKGTWHSGRRLGMKNFSDGRHKSPAPSARAHKWNSVTPIL